MQQLKVKLETALANLFKDKIFVSGSGTELVCDCAEYESQASDTPPSSPSASAPLLHCTMNHYHGGVPFLLFDMDSTILHSTMTGAEPVVWIPPLPRGCPRRVARDPSAVTLRHDIITTGYFVSQLRPGIHHALWRLATQFQLCICSFGADHYLDAVVSALDPTGFIFGNRVLSRSAFPDGTKRVPLEWGRPEDVVVIDDQPAVWETGTIVIGMPPYDETRAAASCAADEYACVEGLVSGLEEMIDTYCFVGHDASARGVVPFGRHVLANWPDEAPVRAALIVPRRQRTPPPLPALVFAEPIPVIGRWEVEAELVDHLYAADDIFCLRPYASNDELMRTVSPLPS